MQGVVQVMPRMWEGRHEASLGHADEYLLSCMRYIELNPVVANQW